MFVKAHPPVATPAVDNKGSCIQLADYLEKENKDKDSRDQLSFFNHKYDEVSKGAAVRQIDSNHRNLGKNDVKFYMVSINPSHHELQHLIKVTTGKDGVENIQELTREQQGKVFVELRNYTRKVMDIYAKNFDRKDINDGNNLVYFARIETARKWKHWEKDVKQGAATKGEFKPGLNLHVHVVVSRNDSDQKTKLSPNSRSKGGTQKLNGKDVQQGFNHEKFKAASGDVFNATYNYKPSYNDTYRNNKISNNNLNVVSNNLPNLTGKITGKLHNEFLQGHLSTELKIIGTVKTIASFVINPQAAIGNLLKQKVAEIIKGDTANER